MGVSFKVQEQKDVESGSRATRKFLQVLFQRSECRQIRSCWKGGKFKQIFYWIHSDHHLNY